jgi:hypothetical protein
MFARTDGSTAGRFDHLSHRRRSSAGPQGLRLKRLLLAPCKPCLELKSLLERVQAKQLVFHCMQVLRPKPGSARNWNDCVGMLPEQCQCCCIAQMQQSVDWLGGMDWPGKVQMTGIHSGQRGSIRQGFGMIRLESSGGDCLKGMNSGGKGR